MKSPGPPPATGRRDPRARFGRWLPYGAGLAGLAAVTAALLALHGAVNPTETVLVYLLVVLAVAAGGGLGAALAVAVAASLSLNYNFLPRVGTWSIDDPANWVALFTFVVTATVTGHLVATVRRRSTEATQRAEEALRLYEFGRSLLGIARPPEAREAIAATSASVLGADACCFCKVRDGTTRFRPADGLPGIPAAWAARELPLAAGEPRAVADGARTVLILPLPRPLGGETILALYGPPKSPPGEATLRALASLIGLAVERAGLLEEALEAEVLRKSEAVKSALLSSVSHDLRTPLSAAQIAATALQDTTVWNDAGVRSELLATMEEAIARLDRAVGNILCMSRIEAGHLRLEQSRATIDDLIRRAVELVGPRRLGGRLQVAVAPGTPPLVCDVGLLATALANLLDNAMKYAPGGSAIEVVAGTRADGRVRIAVLDRGCGVAPGERSTIFQAFRRGTRRAEDVGGVGLGLSIVRSLVQAHGGAVALEPRPGGGTEAVMTLAGAAPGLAAPPADRLGARG